MASRQGIAFNGQLMADGHAFGILFDIAPFLKGTSASTTNYHKKGSDWSYALKLGFKVFYHVQIVLLTPKIDLTFESPLGIFSFAKESFFFCVYFENSCAYLF